MKLKNFERVALCVGGLLVGMTIAYLFVISTDTDTDTDTEVPPCIQATLDRKKVDDTKERLSDESIYPLLGGSAIAAMAVYSVLKASKPYTLGNDTSSPSSTGKSSDVNSAQTSLIIRKKQSLDRKDISFDPPESAPKEEKRAFPEMNDFSPSLLGPREMWGSWEPHILTASFDYPLF